MIRGVTFSRRAFDVVDVITWCCLMFCDGHFEHAIVKPLLCRYAGCTGCVYGLVTCDPSYYGALLLGVTVLRERLAGVSRGRRCMASVVGPGSAMLCVCERWPRMVAFAAAGEESGCKTRDSP